VPGVAFQIRQRAARKRQELLVVDDISPGWLPVLMLYAVVLRMFFSIVALDW
jgi:hypothetical protein